MILNFCVAGTLRERTKENDKCEFILHSAKILWSQVIAQYTVISKHLPVHHFGVPVGLCILTILMHIYKIHPYLQTSLSTCLTVLMYVVRSFTGTKKWHISKKMTMARALTDDSPVCTWDEVEVPGDWLQMCSRLPGGGPMHFCLCALQLTADPKRLKGKTLPPVTWKHSLLKRTASFGPSPPGERGYKSESQSTLSVAHKGLA